MPVFAGTAAADRIVGSAEADQLYGLDGNDTLYGMDGADWLVGGLGSDLLIGGLGNDSYDVDAAGDQVVERAGEGIDYVRASISYQLGANVENLGLTGMAHLVGFGNALDNSITGNAGNNVLNGGAGNDILAGGTGNDVYDVDSAGDKVFERADEGDDRVRASVSFALSANIEELNLGGTADINGFGNALANTITGNAGANVLNGGDGDDALFGGLGDDRLTGGPGNDRMAGGTGNDTYDVDSPNGLVVENAGEGIDRVYVWFNYHLGANIEMLYLKDGVAINGIGNELDNTIFGNSYVNALSGGDGNDILIGAGGNDQLIGGAGDDVLNGEIGFDQMIGGVGNDTYDYDDTGDKIVERPEEGIDQVRTSSYCSLAENIENLIMTGSSSVQGSGNALDNVIIGNAGDNYLDGGIAGNDVISGGDGNDTLYGGVGKDVVLGGAGDDFIGVGAGNYVAGERLDGGDGIDRIEFHPSDPTAVLDSASLPFTNIEDITFFGSEILVDVAFINGLVGINGTVEIKGGGTVDVSGFRHIADTFDLSNAGNHLIMSGQVSYVTVHGGSGSDSVDGTLGNDTLDGNGGADTLNGADGDDQLFGGDGVDTLIGGDGWDWLTGGEGVDTLTGGASFDTFFVWHEMNGDTVTDFTSGTDSFALSNSNVSGTFSYIGSAAFSGAGLAQARFQDGQVSVDFDGNGMTDVSFFTSNITSASQLHTTDFSVWG